jgi:uncharacterized protein (DUF885 family)
LPTYFVGWRDWLRLRQTSGAEPLKQFHDRALKVGSLPLPVGARLLYSKSLAK